MKKASAASMPWTSRLCGGFGEFAIAVHVNDRSRIAQVTHG